MKFLTSNGQSSSNGKTHAFRVSTSGQIAQYSLCGRSNSPEGIPDDEWPECQLCRNLLLDKQKMPKALKRSGNPPQAKPWTLTTFEREPAK